MQVTQEGQSVELMNSVDATVSLFMNNIPLAFQKGS